MFDCTMGSNGEFERRRQELEILSCNTSTIITDEDVVQSYLSALEPV
jgi:hypothetical protein